MKVSELISLLPSDLGFEYNGHSDLIFRGLSVRFEGRPLKDKFAVMLTSSWGPMRIVNRLFAPDKTIAEHLSEAERYGAAGFVLPMEYRNDVALEGRNFFFVRDTTQFAFAVMKAIQASHQVGRITAITGSAGKSTTKSMISHALATLIPKRNIYSPGSTQNVETSMLRHMSVAHRFDHLVLEVAGSAFRTFEQNAFDVSADVSVVTNISEAHLSYLKSLENIAEVKSKIFNSPPPGGTAVVNLDTPCADILVRRAVQAGCQLVTYGESPEATIRLVDYDSEQGVVTAAFGKRRLTYSVGARGKHMAVNSLAVIAVLRAHGFKDWERALESLASFEPLKGRGQRATVSTATRSFSIIDESYNANPASMRAAIGAFVDEPVAEGSKKIAVLGDILELGDESDSIHRGLLDTVAAANFDRVYLVGEQMGHLHEDLSERDPNVSHWHDLDALIDEIKTSLGEGDAILVKASNGTGLHRLVTELTTM